jgi:hypothetical protein
VGQAQTIIGVDFSSSPSQRKPIVLALGELVAAPRAVLRLQSVETFTSLESWGAWLAAKRPWIGGFDLPFGLPRELVQALHWPTHYVACIEHYCALERADIRNIFKAFCDARPAGGKFAHRKTP